MKLLFDENISFRILQLLPEQYAGSTSVKSEALIHSSDREIWNYAKTNGFIIVTRDSDFNDLSSFYGSPPKVIWIRLANPDTQTIRRILVDYRDEIEQFVSEINYGCFEITGIKKL